MRAIIFVAMLVVGTSVCAEPVKVAESDGTSYYVDPAAISVGDAYRRVSVIHDYATPAAGDVRSRSVTYQIDCIEQRLRSVAVTEYSEPMARGQSVAASQRESDWAYVGARTGSYIAQRTPYWSIVRFVCSH